MDRINVELNGEIIVSRPFDMKCYRAVQKLREETEDFDKISENVLIEMFDGTKLTEDIIKNLPLAQQIALIEKAKRITLETLSEIVKIKNSESPIQVKVKL